MTQNELTALIRDMSLEEKAAQLMQLGGMYYSENAADATGPIAESGYTEEQVLMVGSVLGESGAESLKKIQEQIIAHQPHHIPALFMKDVIHGFRTVFPAPLGLGASFDPELVKKCAEIAAEESAASGLHGTFSPMVDLVRDARWGRVMESTGEDPYLNCQMAAAQVKGFQGEGKIDANHVAACVKHFAGYGGAEAGRDYNTVELTERTFLNYYLAGYQGAVDAGVRFVMTSFNTIDGIPATVNKKLMKDILRDRMGFKGILITDYNAIGETINHGVSCDDRDAARRSMNCGVDMDMMTGSYMRALPGLVRDGLLLEEQLDEAVLRILELKNELGLFEDPYREACTEKEAETILKPEFRAFARKVSAACSVLLKNEEMLPVRAEEKIAWIGPYVDNKQIISFWAPAGKAEDSVTVKEAVTEYRKTGENSFAKGCTLLTEDSDFTLFASEPKDRKAEDPEILLQEAVEEARRADKVVLLIGEHFRETGEATSKTVLTLPEHEMRLLREVRKVNPNVIVVLFTGRPLDLRAVCENAAAVLNVWLPGTEGGHAIVDMIMGTQEPAGRLSMTFPYSVGQCPIYYNHLSTGRPCKPGEKFCSRYLDAPNEPLFPFGFGLGYTAFRLSEIRLSADRMAADGKIIASAELENTGSREGTTVVQFYLQDRFASVARPVKELKGFKKLTLQPGEKTVVEFEITEPMLRFIREDMQYASEPGEFVASIGLSSAEDNSVSFVLEYAGRCELLTSAVICGETR